MNVYLFRIDKSTCGGCGCGQAVVAANDPQQAWDCLKHDIGWESEFFNPKKYEQLHCLSYTLKDPIVITYNCYVE